MLSMPTSSPSFYLIHGWGIGPEVWTLFVEKFSDGKNVCMLSLPGYSDSEINWQDKMSIEAIADHLSEQIAPGAVLIGWSLGGMVAIKIAELLQDKISKLILLASTPCFVKKKDWPHGVSKNRMLAISNQLHSSGADVLNTFIGEIAIGDSSPRTTIRTLTKFVNDRTIEPATLDYGLEILSNADLRSSLSNLDCSIGMVLGANDRFVLSSTGHATQSLCADIDLIEIENSGHAPFVSEPHATIKAINRLVENRQ